MGRYVSTKVSVSKPGISYTKDVYGTGNYRLFFSSGNWDVPPGVSSVRATLLGAGGGPGGTYLARSDYYTCCSCGYWYCDTSNYPYIMASQYGGGGAGGGFTIGTASVTPGCTCCIVIGAGGAGGTCVCGYTCYATTPTTVGSQGGFTCAFGICATGGAGGKPAACVCCGNVGSGTCYACWSLTPCCSTLPTGGSGNGNIITVCGNSGSTPCGICAFCYAFGTGYGGASGSPLGYDATTATNTPWAIPDRLNSVSFDGRRLGWNDLQLEYGCLDIPKYPGQIVYTQYCDTQTGTCLYHQAGTPGGFASGCSVYCTSCLSCGGSATCCYVNATKQLWQGSLMCEQGSCTYGICNYCCYVGRWSCNNICKNVYPGCGGGGIPMVWYVTNQGHIQPVQYMCSLPGKSGAPGLAVVEW